MAQTDVRVDARAPGAVAAPVWRAATVTPGLESSFASSIVDLAPDAIVVIDERGRVLLANRVAEAMFGYDREAMVGIDVDRALPEGLRPAHRGQRAEGRPRSLAVSARRADGSEFPAELRLSTVAHGDSSLVVTVVREVTARLDSERVAHERLVLDEHDRIGADLHRRVVGHLFASGMNIQAILDRVDDYVAARLVAVTEELDVAITEIRDTVFQSSRRPSRAGEVDPTVSG